MTFSKKTFWLIKILKDGRNKCKRSTLKQETTIPIILRNLQKVTEHAISNDKNLQYSWD